MDDYFDDDYDDDCCDDGDYADDDFEDPLGIDEDDEYCDEDEAGSDDDFNDDGDESHFTWKEAMFIGGVLGPAYEEGVEARRKKRLKKGVIKPKADREP